MTTKQFRTADDVAEMESELHQIRSELDTTRRALELVAAERTRLQIENTMLEGRVKEHLIKATRAEQLLTNVAGMIVSGIREFKDERDQARAVRRQEQEQRFEAENQTDEPPAFLRRQTNSNPSRQAEQEASAYRGDREAPPRSGGYAQAPRVEDLRSAAERVAPSPRPGTINRTLAARDPRLPNNDFEREPTPQEQDDANLRSIADRMSR